MLFVVVFCSCTIQGLGGENSCLMWKAPFMIILAKISSACTKSLRGRFQRVKFLSEKNYLLASINLSFHPSSTPSPQGRSVNDVILEEGGLIQLDLVQPQ